MPTCIKLAPRWVNARLFEDALRDSGDPLTSGDSCVRFVFPVGCKVMIDAGTRLLSLANQLSYCTKRVVLDFHEGEAGAMGYLNRMGFFEHILPGVEVLPSLPEYSGAQLYKGNNPQIVEFERLHPDCQERQLPGRLTDALLKGCADRSDAKALEGAAFTTFAELIDNVYSHSYTELDGYAALQVYKSRTGNKVFVAVSDSGVGIFETLRPALLAQRSRLAELSDIDLMVRIFAEGVSQHGAHRGCGLKGAAAKAKKYNARIDVRLPNSRVYLSPQGNEYEPDRAYCYDELPLIWGTHLSFEFHLS